MEDVHFEDGDALARFDPLDGSLHPDKRAIRHVDFVSFHISFGNIDDVVVVDKPKDQLLLVFIKRTVEVVHVQDNVETRKPVNVIDELFDMISFDKDVRREEDDFYEPAAAAEIMALQPVGDQAAGIESRIGIFVDHLPGLFFTSCVCPENVVHRKIRNKK